MTDKNCEFGYPCPGPQKVSADDVMKNLYFMSEKEWEHDSQSGIFDYVVVGSSFCALAFTHQMLKNNPKAKILIIERGDYFHPEHFQNFPLAYSATVGGTSETFHWKITDATHEGEYIKWQHGMNNFFGGRSAFWSGWCPEPTREEMAEWPDEVKTVVTDYFPAAKTLLNVIPANKISSKEGERAIFGKLQEDLVDNFLKLCPEEIDAITKVQHAPLAVSANMYRYEGFQKYSASGPLLNLLLIKKYETEEGDQQPLKIVTDCLVKMIYHENGKATCLTTCKGKFILGHAKLILAMGTLPPTTLMLNSFPSLRGIIGTRFTSHFISAITARVPFSDADNVYSSLREQIQGKLEMAAVYIAGENPDSKHQFHIQLTAVIDKTTEANIYDIMRHLPDVAAAPSLELLKTSQNPLHIVFVCACLGQLDHNNVNNWYRLNTDEDYIDITSNAILQVVANDTDNALWDTMDSSTFQVLEDYLDPDGQLEYWHSDTSSWKTREERPPRKQIRLPGMVHEASTMWIGNDDSAPVGLDYRFRGGAENIYLTGGALWPTGASWNPTCAMTALAMHLADSLNNKEKLI